MARRTHLPMPSTQRENTLCGAGLHHESEGTPPPLIAESMQGTDCQRCLKMIEAPFYRERVQRHFNDSSVQPAKPPATRVSLKRRWVKWVAALVGGLLVIMVVIAIVAPPADDEQAAAAAPQQQAVEQAQEAAAAPQQQAVEQAQEQAAAPQQQAVEQAQEQPAAPETDAEIAARCLSPWDGNHEGFEALIRPLLNDPDSMTTHGTRYGRSPSGRFVLLMDYGARNEVGGMVRTEAVATMDEESCAIDLVIEYGW